MSDPLPKSATFAESLAQRLLDEFSGVYYVSNETQRKSIVKGAAQLIDCRLHEADALGIIVPQCLEKPIDISTNGT
jgi:KaiC/GvpD/RAD55 family RecA-like ATPase